MEAKLVFSKVSRLIYDCNRAPDAADAMPARSEIIEVPGNADLSPEERQKRIDTYYKPFRNRLARELAATKLPTLITIHSFTPVYNGKKRDVEIGLLHDQDQRLADAMFETSQNHTSHIVRLNEPYGADDGVTHTLHTLVLSEQDVLPPLPLDVRDGPVRDGGLLHPWRSVFDPNGHQCAYGSALRRVGHAPKGMV